MKHFLGMTRRNLGPLAPPAALEMHAYLNTSRIRSFHALRRNQRSTKTVKRKSRVIRRLSVTAGVRKIAGLGANNLHNSFPCLRPAERRSNGDATFVVKCSARGPPTRLHLPLLSTRKRPHKVGRVVDGATSGLLPFGAAAGGPTPFSDPIFAFSLLRPRIRSLVRRSIVANWQPL